MSAPDATWRVYQAEWLIVYTSDASGQDGMNECGEHFERKYKGRVHDKDRRAGPAIIGRGFGTAGPYCLQLRLPNLRGEFKGLADAWGLAENISGAGAGHQRESLGSPSKLPQVVQRGSAEEQELLDYGKKMLPGDG